MSKTILFVSDCGSRVGLGHLVRSIALAEHLERHHHIHPFLILGEGSDEASRRRIPPRYPVISLNSDASLPESVANTQQITEAAAVIYDLERGAPSDVEREAAGPAKTIGFIGAGYKCVGGEKLDLSFVQGIPIPPPTVPNCLAGPEYVVLRPEFAEPLEPAGEPGTVFVCGGGSDPLDVTALACEALEKLITIQTVNVVTGGLYAGKIKHRPSNRFNLYRGVANPADLMRTCGIAVVSFGMVCLELMACGVPTIALSMSDDHLASAHALAAREGLISIGHAKDIDSRYLGSIILTLTTKQGIRERLREKGRELIDGVGVERVARKIMGVL